MIGHLHMAAVLVFRAAEFNKVHLTPCTAVRSSSIAAASDKRRRLV